MKAFKDHFYSITGCFFLTLSVLLLNLIIQDKIRWRTDLTEDKIYTLTENTKKIISELDTAVEVRFYYSRFNNNMPARLKNYARRIDDLLTEYEQNSNMVKVERLNPQPQSDAEDLAAFDRLKPVTSVGGENLYLGLSVSCLDKTKTLPVLNSEEDSLLEYKLTRAIVQVHRGDKPVVGVLSSLPVLGADVTTEMVQRRQKPAPAWLAFQELNEDFELRRIAPQANSLPKSIDALIVVHPPIISEKMTSSIEQFILNGGKAMIFVDPVSIVSATMLRKQPNSNSLVLASNIEKLLSGWGVAYNPEKAVADNTIARRNGEEKIAGSLSLRPTEINRTNVVTNKLDCIDIFYTGSFGIDQLLPNLKAEPLLTTTTDSQIITAEDLKDHQKIIGSFVSDGTKKNLAVAISGKFPALFENNKKLESKKATVFLIADSDMLFDDVCVQFYELLGTKLKRMLNDNINLLQNSIEYLTGSDQLIGIRSRVHKKRPFTEIQERQAKADLQFKERMLEKSKQINEATAEFKKLAEVSADQKVIITKEQKEGLDKIRHTETLIRREGKKARKELYRDVELLKARIKWICIGLMPLLIAIAGLAAAFIKNRRYAAK